MARFILHKEMLYLKVGNFDQELVGLRPVSDAVEQVRNDPRDDPLDLIIIQVVYVSHGVGLARASLTVGEYCGVQTWGIG